MVRTMDSEGERQRSISTKAEDGTGAIWEFNATGWGWVVMECEVYEVDGD